MHTLYLHIGLPKTGTTAIQMFCEDNRELLKSKGYYYPKTIATYNHVEPRRNGHFLIGMIKKRGGVRDYKKEEQLLKQGLNMIVESFKQYNSIILSDEFLWHGTIKFESNLWTVLKEHSQQNNYQIRIIVYVRRQDDLALSWINQQVKEGWCSAGGCTWNYFLENRELIALDYRKHIDNIATFFGKDAILVRVFERGQFKGEQGNIFSDFLDALGLTLDDGYVVDEEHSNTALTCNGQEIKRIMNRLPAANHVTYPFINKVANLTLRAHSKDDIYEYLSTEDRKEFLSEYMECNNYIAKEYLGRENGNLFSDVSSRVNTKEKWTPQNPHMHEDMIKYFGQIALMQQKEILKLKTEIELLKAGPIKKLLHKIKSFIKSKRKSK